MKIEINNKIATIVRKYCDDNDIRLVDFINDAIETSFYDEKVYCGKPERTKKTGLKEVDDQWKGCPYNVHIHEKFVREYPGNGISYNEFLAHNIRVERSYDWLHKQKYKSKR